MNDKSKIIKFPSYRSKRVSYDDDPHDFEEWEIYAELIDKKNYPELVCYFEEKTKKYPKDLYAKYYLGEAYILNGEYDRAIEYMGKNHKKYPDISDYQHIILDALYALGKTEDDYDWSEKPEILRMSIAIIDRCYEFLKYKRIPRSISELYMQFLTSGEYLLFTEKDLLNEILKDKRFEVDDPESVVWADVCVARKRKK